MSNKIALVTGSSRGIGKAIALTLAKDGYDIIVNYKSNQGKAKETGKEIEKLGRKAHLIQTDVSKDKEVEEMFKKVSKITNQLDAVVSNAGYDYAKLIEDYTMEEMRYIVDLILIAKFSVTKYALPLLKKSPRASIVNIASRMGKEKTIKTIGAYGPAEAGVIKFTQCCALEFGDYKIRVNCVAPGLTRTDLTNDLFKTKEQWKVFEDANPSKRVGQPQDIANAVSFLISDRADYINGETIGVNGGSNLG
jgi:3-oxoacyl-[acyl-carrier protein] reductase